MKRFSYNTLKNQIIKIVRRYNVPSHEIEIFVDNLLEANLVGVDTHGLSRLKIYLDRIKRGSLIPMQKWFSNIICHQQAYWMQKMGLGKIGFRVAMHAKAFGMRILAFDKFISASQPAVTEIGAELTPTRSG